MQQNGSDRRIILVRHGESLANQMGFYNSHPKNSGYVVVPLTKRGERQATEFGQQLLNTPYAENNIDGVFCSPLPRARSTARILMEAMGLEGLKPVEDERLMEIDMGQREGASLNRFQESDHWYPDDPESFGAESTASVRDRMQAAWQDIVQLPGEGHIIVVSHGVPLVELVKSLTGKTIRLGNMEAVHVDTDGGMLSP